MPHAQNINMPDTFCLMTTGRLLNFFPNNLLFINISVNDSFLHIEINIFLSVTKLSST